MVQSVTETRFIEALGTYQNSLVRRLLESQSIDPNMLYGKAPVIYQAFRIHNYHAARDLHDAGARLDVNVGDRPMAFALSNNLRALRAYQQLGGSLAVSHEGKSLLSLFEERKSAKGVLLCIKKGGETADNVTTPWAKHLIARARHKSCFYYNT